MTTQKDSLINSEFSLNRSIPGTKKSTRFSLGKVGATKAKREKQRKLTIIFYMIMVISAILFSLLAILIQYGSNLGYPSGELLMFRGAEQILIIIISIMINRDYNSIKTNISKLNKYDIMWLILRGVCGAFAGLCYFLAICILPVGDAIAVFSIYPIFCLIAASVILNETIKLIYFILLITSSIGVILVAQPTFLSFMFPDNLVNDNGINKIYYIIPVIGAIFAAFSFISMRKSKKTNTKLLVLSYSVFSFFCGIISVIVYHYCELFENHVLFKFVGFNNWYHIKQWLVLLSMGIIGYAAQITMTISAKKLEAGVSSFIRSSDITWTYIFGVIFFKQTPSWFTIFGALLIFGSIMGVCIIKYLKKFRMKTIPNSKTEPLK